jgi:hypothetical protein
MAWILSEIIQRLRSSEEAPLLLSAKQSYTLPIDLSCCLLRNSHILSVIIRWNNIALKQSQCSCASVGIAASYYLCLHVLVSSLLLSIWIHLRFKFTPYWASVSSVVQVLTEQWCVILSTVRWRGQGLDIRAVVVRFRAKERDWSLRQCIPTVSGAQSTSY